MQRGTTGRYEISDFGDEQVRAFIPNPLPPEPNVSLEGDLLEIYGEANRALGRLDGISVFLSDQTLFHPTLFLYFYARKEAVLSSQIEGTQSSLSDLLQYERAEAPGVPEGDAAEVSRYVSALNHGLKRLRNDDFPVSNRLMREVHEILLKTGRGSDKLPGEFRRSQNWIGGSRPGNAFYVPPPPTHVQDCMAGLERFLHARGDGLPTLIRIGLAHVQLETIHPFLDGNGRVGRLLITLLLCSSGILSDPLLYLSLYLKENRSQYYDLLNEVRLTGDWEAWLAFFLEGVRITAEEAVSTALRLRAMIERDQGRIAKSGRRASSALRVHQAFAKHPVHSISSISETTGLAFSVASAGVRLLEEIGMVREVTRKLRNRIYIYDEYMSVLNEGT